MIIQEISIDNFRLSLFGFSLLMIGEDSYRSTYGSTVILKHNAFTDKYYLIRIKENSTSTRDSLIIFK